MCYKVFKDIEIIDLSDEDKKSFKDAIYSLRKSLPNAIKNQKNLIAKFRMWKLYKLILIRNKKDENRI